MELSLEMRRDAAFNCSYGRWNKRKSATSGLDPATSSISPHFCPLRGLMLEVLCTGVTWSVSAMITESVNRKRLHAQEAVCVAAMRGI